MPQDPLPEDLTDALLDDTAADALPPAPPAERARPAVPRLWIAGGAAVVIAAVGTGWALGRAGAPLPSASTPARAQVVAEAPAPSSPEVLPLPVADVAKKERNRFTRADRDDDGQVQQSEYLTTRRRNYDKLDANRDGRLDFAEYAAAGIEKFAAADIDRSGTLDATEFTATAPKPRAKRPAPCTTTPDSAE